jgi:hypothetical protein
VTARSFGIDERLLSALLSDIDTAPIREQLKPIFRYVEKLTRSPGRMIPADSAAVYEAGWDDRALHDAISVCALFNLMNRLVDGTGISSDRAYYELSGERLHKGGYAALLKLLDG